MYQRRNFCHYKPVAGYQLENSTALVTIITIDFTVHVHLSQAKRCISTDTACTALQYFVLLSIVTVMLTHVLVIIINQSTITLCNFYYNYYYRESLPITITLVLRLSIAITITLYQAIFTITITHY